MVERGPGLFSEKLRQPKLAAFGSWNQFRESLWIARNLHPDDDRLRQLDRGEPGHRQPFSIPRRCGDREPMNPDEFMRSAQSPYGPTIGRSRLQVMERSLAGRCTVW